MDKNIHELGEKDLKKPFSDVRFMMFAEGGAMGEPGAVYVLTADRSIYHLNYVFGDVKIKSLERVLPVLKGCEFGMFGEGSVVPDGWKYVNLGAGNHLVAKEDAYDDFISDVGEDKDPSEIYACWMEKALEYIDNEIEQERIMDDLEGGYDPFEDERMYVTQKLVHPDKIPDSLDVKEGFLSDGRSYMSEMWCYEQTTNVTYYIPVDDPLRGELPDDDKFLEDYLISEGKIKRGEEHHIAKKVLHTTEGDVYSLSVCVGCDDDLFCEAYM